MVGRESDLRPDGGRAFRLSPDGCGNVELREDREKRQAIDFGEMNQWAGIYDCG